MATILRLADTDYVTVAKCNELWASCRTFVSELEAQYAALESRYINAIAARNLLLTEVASVNSRISALTASSSQTTSATGATTNTNNAALVTTGNTTYSGYNTRNTAIVPDSNYLAYNSNWASARFASFTAATGNVFALNSSGNFVSQAPPVNLDYADTCVVWEAGATTGGGQIVANTAKARTFTHISASDSWFAKLVSGYLVLKAGFYIIMYDGKSNGLNACQTHLLDKDSRAVLLEGVSCNGIIGSNTDNSFNQSHLVVGVITLTKETTLEFNILSDSANGYNAEWSLGAPGATGTNIYQYCSIIREQR